MPNPQQPLLTKESVALSLAPPRSPPGGDVIRNLYADPHLSAARLFAILTSEAAAGNNSDENHSDYNISSYESHNLKRRFVQLLHDGNRVLHYSIHPHIPTSLSLPDQLIRFLGRALPLEWQHRNRDNGTFRLVADGLVKLTCPMIGLSNLRLTHKFIELSSTKRRRRIKYGHYHRMQYIDLFLPQRNDTKQQNKTQTKNNHSSSTGKVPVRGTLFFVHGGAWGSGHPWMYRLVAPTFLERNFAVAIVGYRTYPDAPNIDDQVDDIRLAYNELDEVLNECVVPVADDYDATDREGDSNNGWVGNIMMGHSSGAHIALLLLVDMISERMRSSPSSLASTVENNRYPWSLPDYFVGLSGPYDISYHFDFEAGRGVEQISPMKPICGHSRSNFDKSSPAKRLLSRLASFRENNGLQHVPMLLVHGIEDATVPFTATSDASRILKSCGWNDCNEIYLDRTGHQDVIMHFMLQNGSALDAVFNWLHERQQKLFGQEGNRRIVLQSRL
jgi:alpha-beta hydrolase superfamily lysophospholipase